MARNEPQINLRIPEELKEALDKAAALNKRSLTAEVVARLQSTLTGVDTWAQAFPSAAEAAFGRNPNRVQEETMETLQRMELSATIDRVRSMEAQLVQLEAQCQQAAHDRDRYESWMEQAANHGPEEDVAKWRGHLERTVPMLMRLDAQVVKLQRAIKEERIVLKRLEARGNRAATLK